MISIGYENQCFALSNVIIGRIYNFRSFNINYDNY